ncbi:MAG: sulfotransferase [Bacteroidota bacterium]
MQSLFIHGYSKSGTSLLVALLDGHPEINVIPEESDYFDGLYFMVERFLQSSKLNNEEKIDQLYLRLTHSTHIKNFFKGLSIDDPRGNFDYREFDGASFETKFKLFLKENGIDHQNFFRALAYAYNAGIGKAPTQKYWLEKTPYHDLNVSNREEILNSQFEGYKVIHIFRDIRDNFLAYSKKRPELNIYDICYEWKRIVNLAFEWGKTENNLIIRYEDLVLNTKETMNKILDFIDLQPSEKIYVPTKNGAPWLGNSMFGQKSAKISADRLNRYLKLMDDDTRNTIESLCAKEMKKLNYKIDSDRANGFSLPFQFAKWKSFYKKMIKAFKINWVLKYRY